MRFSTELPWDKYGIIIELVRRLQDKSPQIGKTVMQKMVYLLKEIYNVPCGYEYSLYTYGTYSAELTSDVEAVAAMKGLDLKEGIFGYQITSGENSLTIMEKNLLVF